MLGPVEATITSSRAAHTGNRRIAPQGVWTFASLMIGAGVNAKALSTYMGHASVTITFDRYGHLMPGDAEAAGLVDAYLARAAETHA